MLLRIGSFTAVFAALMLAETLLPRRKRVENRLRRWSTNVAMIAIGTLALRLLFPLVALTMAALAEARGWGLLNALDWPIWLEFALAILALDLAIYLQHVATHRIPLLWRLHKVHHADRDIDVTTGFRFHPFEILASMAYKVAVVAALGPSVAAVFVFELLLSAFPMFNHANLRLPGWLERPLRWLIVTPDMHRVHHSVIVAETNSNYGFNLSLWDRLFGTYRDQPQAGHEGMTIGLAEYADKRPSRLGASLAMPFGTEARRYAEPQSKDPRRGCAGGPRKRA